MNYCTVIYDGKAQKAQHLIMGLNLKGLLYKTGEAIDVTAEQAGLLVACAPKGTVKVLKGTPKTPKLMTRYAKEVARVATERMRRFPVDPFKAYDHIEAIGADLLKVLTGKKGVEYVEDGKCDACLGEVALWAKLTGRTEVGKAASRRAAELAEEAG